MCRFGRDNFEEALKITKRVDLNDTNWDHFKYMVYDIPNHSGPYRERYAALGKIAHQKHMPLILNTFRGKASQLSELNHSSGSQSCVPRCSTP